MPDGRYRIVERLAAGGMAEVFKGIAESLQGFRKSVAIKRVLPGLTKNKKFIAMFLDEARLSLHLQHANIVQVFDIGHADDTYFIVMEFVDGVDLKQILEWRRRMGRPLTIGQTIYTIIEICKALAYAHDLLHPETGRPLGIVHRDISPPNVLISRSGELKLADFGLAKAASQIETTDPGVVKGKMSYLSPEAARGEEVDRRADIFSAGILLYEMLTGKRLFYGDTDYQTVELVRAAKIPPIAPQNPEVEPELEEIVRKALSRRLEDRFQTAADLQDALAHYLFSRGLKMLQRDIADLVRGCIEDLATVSGAKKPKTGIVDTLVHRELDSFISVDFQDPNVSHLITEVRDAVGGGDPGPDDLIDPRAWASDPDMSSKRRTTNHGRRGTGGVSRPTEPSLPPVMMMDEVRPARGIAAVASDPLLGGPAGEAPRRPSSQSPLPVSPGALPPPAPRSMSAASIAGIVAGALVLGGIAAALLLGR